MIYALHSICLIVLAIYRLYVLYRFSSPVELPTSLLYMAKFLLCGVLICLPIMRVILRVALNTWEPYEIFGDLLMATAWVSNTLDLPPTPEQNPHSGSSSRQTLFTCSILITNLVNKKIHNLSALCYAAIGSGIRQRPVGVLGAEDLVGDGLHHIRC